MNVTANRLLLHPPLISKHFWSIVLFFWTGTKIVVGGIEMLYQAHKEIEFIHKHNNELI